MDVYSTCSSRKVYQNVCSLMDQGINFASKLLQKLYELLQVKAIKTSPCHSETDGLVEHFKQKLRSMLNEC